MDSCKRLEGILPSGDSGAEINFKGLAALQRVMNTCEGDVMTIKVEVIDIAVVET